MLSLSLCFFDVFVSGQVSDVFTHPVNSISLSRLNYCKKFLIYIILKLCISVCMGMKLVFSRETT
jgi:hypothetical protein